MKATRIALIGAGGIAAYAHKKAFLQHPERLRVVGITDPNQEVAARLAGELGTEIPVFADHRTMLESLNGGIDGVLITTPHFLHAPMASDVLKDGLPALVEKPLVCNLEEMRLLQSLEKPGAFVQAGQMQRFGREENWIKTWLASDAFGDPRLFNLDIYQNIDSYTHGREDFWILDKKRAGGGIVISVAIHILDLLRYWLDDDYVEVCARGRFDPPLKNGAESTVVATITTRRGALGTLNSSYTAARCPYSQRTLLFGTHGSLCQHIDKPGGGYAGNYFTASDGGKPTLEWDRMYSGWSAVKDQMGADPGESDPFTSQMLAFADNIDCGRASENSLTRNWNTIALIDALGRSLISGKPETVESF